MAKNIVILVMSLILAIVIVIFVPGESSYLSHNSYDTEAKEDNLISQTITSVSTSPKTIYKLYESSKLVGVLSSENKLNRFLNDIYEESYATLFPDSKLALGKNVYVIEEQSYFNYENKDDEILNYLKENQLFSIKATLVRFSDDNGVNK